MAVRKKMSRINFLPIVPVNKTSGNNNRLVSEMAPQLFRPRKARLVTLSTSPAKQYGHPAFEVAAVFSVVDVAFN